jgi:hypothetical protein
VLFSRRIWQHIQILLLGAILTPGQRMVTTVLRILGVSAEKHFQNYHRVLNRAIWSSREASRLLLRLLVTAFVPCGPIVMGLDDTIKGKIPIRQDTWYCKPLPTFSEALALVRQELWQHRYFQLSQDRYDVRKVKPELLDYLQNAVFYTP